MDSDKKYSCEVCTQNFTRKNNLNRHKKSKHEHISLDFSCYICKKSFKNQESYLRHIGKHKEGLSFVLFKDAFNSYGHIFRKHLKNYFSLNSIFNEVDDIQNLLQNQVLEYPKFKINIHIEVEYVLKGTDNITV